MTVYAENVNYFKSSSTHAATWIDRAKKEIVHIGGKINKEAFASDGAASGFMLAFRIGNEDFVINWLVLPCRFKKNERAAVIQAATLLYHDVKHKCVMAKIKGVNRAFLEYMMLPNGQSVGEIATNPRQLLPEILALPERT